MSQTEESSVKSITLPWAGLSMFLIFLGLSSGQFHSYLFESRGLQSLQIGLIIMAGQGAGILSPLFQVSIIRRFHGPRPPLILMIAGATAALVALPRLHGFWPLLIGFCAFSFCVAGVLPLNAACTLEAMRNQGHGAFFRIRSLGTTGFMVGCVISVFFPALGDLPLLYGGFALAFLAALAVVAWEYGTAPAGEGFQAGKVSGGIGPARVHGRVMPTFSAALGLLREPRTLRLLLLLGVMNFANAMALGVQGNYLIDRWDQGQRSISVAWVVSTACEIPLMLLCATLLRKVGLRYVIGLGIAGTVVKLVGLALAGEVWQYYLALALHGCFFSGAVTGFSIYLDRTYKREERAALQALAPVFHAGIPSSLAGLAAGVLWHVFSLQAVYLASGGIAMAAAVCALAWLRISGQSRHKNVL